MLKSLSFSVGRIVLALLITMLFAVTFSSGVEAREATSSTSSTNGCFSSPSESGCDGQDPQTTGCASGAITLVTAFILNSFGDAIGQVELRYSPHCGTNWARTTSYGAGSVSLQAHITRCSVAATNGTCPGTTTLLSSAPAQPYSVYSPMFYAPVKGASATGSLIFGSQIIEATTIFV